MLSLTYIDGAAWIQGKLELKETSSFITLRRSRAKTVLENFTANHYQLEGKAIQVTFTRHSEKYTVVLAQSQVGCNCADLASRKIPCKHVFAAASVAGDKTALGEPIEVDSDRRWHKNTRAQDVRIGKYFVLSDFLYSTEQASQGIANFIEDYEGKEVYSLRQLAAHILDPVVEQFGPVSITYGYVSPTLQAATYGDVGGVHCCLPTKEKGAKFAAAADILVHSQAATPRHVLNWIRDNCPFDRLILYPHSPIICTAWADKPRFHCKEWIFPDSFGKALYINAIRQVRPSDGVIEVVKIVEPKLAQDFDAPYDQPNLFF